MDMLLDRPRLRRLMTDGNHRVLLLQAGAGAGKSVLLRQMAEDAGARVCTALHPQQADLEGGMLFWDLPRKARSLRLSDAVIDNAERIVIACRPQQKVTGLARAKLHGGCRVLLAEDLSFNDEDLITLPPQTQRAVLETYAGWPAFLRLALGDGEDDGSLVDYCREALFDHLTPGDMAALSLWLKAPDQPVPAIAATLMPPRLLAEPDRYPVLVETLRRASGESLAAYVSPTALKDIASTLEQSGQVLAAMNLLLDHGLEAQAAAILERADGRDLIYRSSLAEFQDIVLRFSHESVAENETILFAICRALMKQGELHRVRHLLSKHLGLDYLDPMKVLVKGSRFSFAARTFRLNLMISEDLTPNDAMIERLAEFMADYPLGEHGKWAAYYNALLEFEIRRRNFREAEAAAARALIYLKKMGGQPLLEFFIHLHQTVLRLMSGDALLARKAAQDARVRLEQVPHPADAEFRMLRLAEACLDYEVGRQRALLQFVQNEFEEFAAAEIWPSLMQFALHYAAQALIDHFPMGVRPGFLDGLWIHLSDGLQFHAMMEIRTAIAYQNAGRWREAAATLSAIRMPMGKHWIDSAVEDLTRFSRRDEIAYVMAWFREAVHLWTPRPYLARQLEALIANPKVTHRERVALEIWLGYTAHQRRETAAARSHLLSALESAHRLGCHGVLSEERLFLSPLLESRTLRAFVETSVGVRSALAIFTSSLNSPHARALKGGLSQREAQMLQLAAGGLSNKRIAATLNISEVTVKYHLGNLYRKLGCNRRAEALRAAMALGWIS
ncbi:helix-turn-helix transcriptional regulator [Rhizobium straminoryzae]|uniref:Helix-turn-helix transcriptional regulator n=1 Tax=Rhizobium straminoryzae TaxID=1387186 RepID=A0A549THJ1_9HYPH|nr:LuxR family transcriptional regulator [Rhizobium straminoryzae]TRL42489.1 helix-turn-helix transcriptional regulator [Rhizobium straminoryzae]